MSDQGLRAHPVAECFPPLTEAEFSDLVADIREHGVRVPIVTTADGLIVDGLHRWKAAQQAGRDCPSVLLPAGDDPWQAGVSLNVARRHLDASQRAMVAHRLSKESTHGGDRTSEQEPNSSFALTQTQAADTMGVGISAVKSARKVEERGAVELVAAVDAGKRAGGVAVSDAAAVATKTHDEQRGFLKAVQQGKAKTLREAAGATNWADWIKAEERKMVLKDYELQIEHEKASRQLAELRWNWTTNPENPDRVSFKQYAKDVGVSEHDIRSYAGAWELIQTESEETG